MTPTPNTARHQSLHVVASDILGVRHIQRLTAVVDSVVPDETQARRVRTDKRASKRRGSIARRQEQTRVRKAEPVLGPVHGPRTLADVVAFEKREAKRAARVTVDESVVVELPVAQRGSNNGWR
jgi:hypothetical protein